MCFVNYNGIKVPSKETATKKIYIKKNGANKLCNKNPNLISLEILQVNFIKFQFESVTVIAKLRNESFT